MPFQAKKRFGELLVEEDRIKEQDLERALREQKRYGRKLGQVLLEMGLVSEETIAEVLGRQLGVPVARLDDAELPGDLVGLIPKSIAKNCNVIPIERHYDWVRVAMTDPLDTAAMDEVAHFLRLEVLPSVATEGEINRALERYYGMRRPAEDRQDNPAPDRDLEPEAARGATWAPEEAGEENSVESLAKRTAALVFADRDEGAQPQNDEETIRTGPPLPSAGTLDPSLVSLVSQAVSLEATDIHIETGRNGGCVRMRVNGKLTTVSPFHDKAPSELARAVKGWAGLEETPPGLNEGRFDFSEDVGLRVSTCTTMGGERMVLRLVDKRLCSGDLQGLGMAPDMEEKITRLLKHPGGLVLCTGPAGSGKTTTLYAVLNGLNGVDKALVTVEDPVEYAVDHASQMLIDPKRDKAFREALRRAARQDPDVLAVGEIREGETAVLAMQAALAGITVLSTFCWNDAVGTLVRLLRMGLEPSLVASSTACVLSQRLLRKICEGCKESYTPPQPILESVNVSEAVPLYRGTGCPACRNTGYRGRTAVFEVLFVDKELKDLVAAGASRAELHEAALAGGMKTTREEAIRKALLGVTTLEEALNRTR